MALGNQIVSVYLPQWQPLLFKILQALLMMMYDMINVEVMEV